MDLLPRVFRTEGNIAEFTPSKIYESILKETGISEKDATRITELVVRRIISSGIKFLSGPHIREMVCSILSEQHFENERKLYTRIGMPLMDYEKIIEKSRNANIINPEKTHHWAANQIAKEYAHLRLLDSEESKAHLFGDIHIEGLHYFDSRPFNQIWDLRLILSNGYLFNNDSDSICRVKPARTLNEAVQHLSKWIGMTQSEFYGIQAYNAITVFLAPYAKGLSDDKIKKIMRNLICEVSQLSLIIGREIPPTSISSSPFILKDLEDVVAITPNEAVKEVYGSYSEECLRLFKALTLAFKEEGKAKNVIKTPKFQILFDSIWQNKNSEAYSNIWEEIKESHNTYLVNSCSYSYKERIDQISNNNYVNSGILQKINLNLPHYAYLGQNEERFLDLLFENIKLSSEIFLKKYEIIKKRIKSKHLPLCTSVSNGNPIFKLENQEFSISFVGLNESVKFLTNHELHEDLNSFSFGIKIVEEMRKICQELSIENDKKYELSENFSEQTRIRFSKLDLKHFKNQFKSLLGEKGGIYSNSFHFREDCGIELFNRVKKQGQFHQLIAEAVEHFSLYQLQKNNINFHDFVIAICKDSNLACVKFNS